MSSSGMNAWHGYRSGRECMSSRDMSNMMGSIRPVYSQWENLVCKWKPPYLISLKVVWYICMTFDSDCTAKQA